MISVSALSHPRLRVCMLAPSHPAWDPRVVQREARSLAKMGHRVSVVAMHDGRRPFPPELELLPLPSRRLNRWKRALLIWRVYRMALRWRADVYHVHEVESLVAGVLLKWRTGAKLVFDAHECFQFTAARFLSGWKARLVTRVTTCFLHFLARRADHVIVVSFTNELFYREDCGCTRMDIIYNSPPLEMFPFEHKPPEAAWTLTHDGFLGRSRGQQQILHALAIVRKETPIRFLVVGELQEADREEFDRSVAELGLQDIVEVTGWIPFEQVGPALNRGSIGLIAMQPTPNNYKSLSNKLFNYMATGQAVIGPSGSDTEEVIRRANCGLAADMTKPESLADALLSLLRHPHRTRDLGLNGRRAIEAEFGWHRMEDLLQRIYGRLAGVRIQEDIRGYEEPPGAVTSKT